MRDTRRSKKVKLDADFVYELPKMRAKTSTLPANVSSRAEQQVTSSKKAAVFSRRPTLLEHSPEAKALPSSRHCVIYESFRIGHKEVRNQTRNEGHVDKEVRSAGSRQPCR